MYSRQKCPIEKEGVLMLDILLVLLIFAWAALVWLYREMRKQDRRFEEISDAVAEMNRNLRWSVIQGVALSMALWQTGGRGVMQVKVPFTPDGSSQKVVMVSVTSQAVVVSSPGETELVARIGV